MKTIILSILLCSAIIPVYADILTQDPDTSTEIRSSPSSKAFRHDGFYFNFQIGPGFGKYSIDTPEPIDTAKAYFMTDWQLGYAVVDNLIIYFDFGLSAMSGGKVKPDKYQYQDTPLILWTMMPGIGVRYYFMPGNYFLSAAISRYSNFTNDDIGSYNSASSNMSQYHIVDGIGTTVSFGKEWWVSENWGIGFSVFWFYGWGNANSNYFIKGYSSTETSYGVNVSFSYN
jgi:hypothetical protein